MHVSINPLYLYDHVYQLLLDKNECPCGGDNGPMNKKYIKAHKGVDNSIKFRVLDPDRNPVNICSYQIYARIIEPKERIIVLEKLCTVGSARGMIFLDLDEGDLAPIHPGLYEMVIIGTKEFVATVPNEYTYTPFYSDFDNDIKFSIEITEQAYKTPYPTVVIEEKDWTPDRTIPSCTCPTHVWFYSEAIPGARVRNHLHSVHTFSVHAENFTGALEIYGTLEPTPTPHLESNRYFKIWPSSLMDRIEFRHFTGTEAFTFSANVMYLKFKLIPEPCTLPGQYNGCIKKILVRT